MVILMFCIFKDGVVNVLLDFDELFELSVFGTHERRVEFEDVPMPNFSAKAFALFALKINIWIKEN